MATSRICSIPNCGKPHEARGWCNMHYIRWKKTGSVSLDPTTSPRTFFEEVVLPYEGDNCLIWPFARFPAGYAVMGQGTVHRRVCTIVNGPPPTREHQAAHTCGNGLGGCVNPKHLAWKTPVENQADRIRHGTHTRGERNHATKLTEADVRAIRASSEKLRVVAERYGVTEALISAIRHRKAWAWMD